MTQPTDDTGPPAAHMDAAGGPPARSAEAEQALQARCAQLEQTLRERTLELERATEEMKSFTYSVSHDLRAPLRAIQGFTELLEQETEQITPQGKEMLQRVQKNTRRMSQMIEDMLKLSRMGRAEIKLRRTELAPLVGEVAQELCANYPEAQIGVERLPSVDCDPVLIRAAFQNLIDNALKFSAATAEPRVEIGFQPGQQGEQVVFVRDNGTGFDMQYASRLFGVFQRLHKETEFPGSGVGLAVVKRIVERHGGRVWCEAAPGQGATFYIAFKAAG